MGQAKRRLPEALALTDGRPEAIGAYLARQRRLRGITLDALAADTRLPRRSLERLEAGAYDGTPDGFVRGFVRTVAAALGLDPDETIARMLPEPALDARGAHARWIQLLSRPAGWVGLAVVAASAVALWLVASGAPRAVAVRGDGTTRIHRRDAVRELAESGGALAPPAEAPAEPSRDAP